MIRQGRIQGRKTSQKPKEHQEYTFPGPTNGLMAMNNLAVSVPGSATVLENWFPTATGAIMRRGKALYATLGNGDKPVLSMFSYVVGNKRDFFAATEDTVYDITTVLEPSNVLIGTEDDDIIGTEDGDMIGVQSTDGLDVLTGQAGGKWVTVQTATSGGVFLIGVNGQDDSFVYDGQTFYPQVADGLFKLNFDGGTVEFTVGETVTGGTSGATAVIVKVIPSDPDNPEVAGELWVKSVANGPFSDNETLTDGEGGAAVADGINTIVPGTDLSFPAGVSLTGADLSYVWSFKNRLWFLQKDSLSAWYLDVDSISGELTEFPLGGILGKGGKLVIGTTWSQDLGNGLNALCAFISSEGEAAVYQGSNPGEADDFGIVGIYQTGKPLGPLAHVKVGGDIVMAADVAFVPLSEALRREYSQLGANSLSAPIEALWPQEVEARSGAEWNCAFWSEQQMIVVALPNIPNQDPGMLVVNSRTGKWARYTNWGSTCVHVFNGRLFIGDTEGRVYEANVTGLDDGEPYTATYLPSFDQLGVPGYKSIVQARAVLKGKHKVREQLSTHTDYNVLVPPAPAATQVSAPGVWGDPGTIWGQFAWGSQSGAHIQQNWRTQYGAGEVISIGVQITSGSIIPLDEEIIRTDVVFGVGGAVVE
jgi:hypothetical protein